MYNAHRGMVPAPNSRLTELLDQVRQEFDSQSRSTGEFEHQRTFSPSSVVGIHSPFVSPSWAVGVSSNPSRARRGEEQSSILMSENHAMLINMRV